MRGFKQLYSILTSTLFIKLKVKLKDVSKSGHESWQKSDETKLINYWTILSQMFTGTVKVTDGTLCLWDPRTPLANTGTILEIVNGCGYPQPTRVSIVKIELVTPVSAVIYFTFHNIVLVARL